jgi:hypothetical protein
MVHIVEEKMQQTSSGKFPTPETNESRAMHPRTGTVQAKGIEMSRIH